MKQVKWLVSVLIVLSIMLFMGCSGKDDNGGGGSGLPSVPNASVNDGALDDRGGQTIMNEDDLEAAMYEIMNALDNLGDIPLFVNGGSRGLRAANIRKMESYKMDTSFFVSGYNNGRIDSKFSGQIKYDDEKEYISATVSSKMVYSDYSDNGRMYIGGGIGTAMYMEESYSKDVYEVKVNGGIRFDGMYKGSLEFKNFYAKYSYNWNTDKESSDFKGTIVLKSGDFEEDLTEEFANDLLDMYF
jgi:hypothetical protein